MRSRRATVAVKAAPSFVWETDATLPAAPLKDGMPIWAENSEILRAATRMSLMFLRSKALWTLAS